jgi:hypothetical protein
VHRPLCEEGEDGGPDVAAPSPWAAATAAVAEGAGARELLVAMVAGMAGIVSVVHRKYLSIDI